MKIKKYTNGAWIDLDKPVKKFATYTDTATTLPLMIETSGTDAVENVRVYGASGGVGEKTINKFNKEAPWYRENRYYNSAGSAASTENWNISGPINVKPNTTYTLYYGAQANSPSLCEFDSNDIKINIVSYNNESPCIFTTSADTSYIQASIRKNRVDTVYLIEGDEALENFVPYGYEILLTNTNGQNADSYPLYVGDTQLYSDEYTDFETQKVYKYVDGVLTPQDPPLPFPTLTSYIGENNLSVDTTVQPEQVVCEYKGWKPAGDGEVKYYHNSWVNTPPPAKPSWLADGYEAVLDAQTAPSDYYCDLAYIDNDVQFVYRVYAQPEVSCKIEKSNNYLTVYQDPYTVGYNGFTTYGARYNGSSWYLASSTLNKNGGPTAYANGTSQRAILASTITNLVNASGMTFEDYR